MMTPAMMWLQLRASTACKAGEGVELRAYDATYLRSPQSLGATTTMAELRLRRR